MNPQDLLNRSFCCSCGQEHNASIRNFFYVKNLSEQISSWVLEKGLIPGHTKILVVADQRTWEVCGGKIWERIREFQEASFLLVPDGKNSGPLCDGDTMQRLKEKAVQASPGFLLAVGSGVINDLCKWISFELDLPYGVIATAASMNGFAAANVAPMVDGVKVLIRARPPIFVGADPVVIENAPFVMTAAGFGDTIAKFMSNTDWWMNHFLFNEYYCQFCSRLLDPFEYSLLNNPEKIAQKDPEAIRTLFEALFWSGVAMTLTGTSAPASGGEHLLSHTLDMVSVIHHSRHDLHGRQVGLGTVFSAALYEKILSIDNPAFVSVPNRIDRNYWKKPQVISTVMEQYDRKKPFFQMASEKLSIPDNWKILQDGLKSRIKSPVQVKEWLRRAGAAHTAGEIGCGREQILQAVLHMHEIRKRFTVVDLAWLLGILPASAEEIIARWLME